MSSEGDKVTPNVLNLYIEDKGGHQLEPAQLSPTADGRHD